MKITGVATSRLFASATAGEAVTTNCLLELQTDEELTGIAITPADAEPIVLRLAQSLLLGADPRASFGLYERMNEALGTCGPNDALARAALDLAIWDLKAKAECNPLWRTLGGGRPRANAHVHWSGTRVDNKAANKWFKHIRDECGIRRASISATRNIDTDLSRLVHVRAMLDANTLDSALMLDFGARWWPGDVIRHTRAIEQSVDLTWIRSPAASGDFLGAQHVAGAVTAPVVCGQQLASRAAFLPYLQNYAANIVELDINLLGISGVLQMADAAFGFELPVVLSAAPGNVHVHVASALATVMSVEVWNADDRDSRLDTDVVITAGRIGAGLRPGTGMLIKREVPSA